MPIHKIRLPGALPPSSSLPPSVPPSSHPPPPLSSPPTDIDPHQSSLPSGTRPFRKWNTRSRKTDLPPPEERNPPPDELTCEEIDNVCNGDVRLAERWKHLLSNFVVVTDEDDDITVKKNSFIRYADLRERPLNLRKGGFLIEITPDYLFLKNGNAFWKILRRFYVIFRRKTDDDLFLEAIESVMETINKKYGP
jgi:hypothetical protein